MILVTCILLRMRGRPSRDAWILLAATSVWRGMRVAIVSSNLKGGMWPTHKGGTPLCHSYGIKQGFRLAQTLVYSQL